MQTSYLHRVHRETKLLRDAIGHTHGSKNVLYVQADQLYESISAMVVLADQEAAARFKREYRGGKYDDGDPKEYDKIIDGEYNEITNRRIR